MNPEDEMPAGGGTALYPARSTPPNPSHAEYAAEFVRLVRSPEAALPSCDFLVGMVSVGVLTQNEARVVVDTWYEHYSMPSFYVSPPEL